MKSPAAVWKVGLFALVVGLGSDLSSAQTAAPTPLEYPRSLSGLVGITSNQVARLTAVNVSDRAEIASFKWLDTAGTVVKASTVKLLPGEAGFLDVSITDATPIGAAAATRVELRGVVDTLPAVQNSAFPPDPCLSTLEVIAENGLTTLINPIFRISLNPQPLPP
jgi:hypothetical protein